jgi:hypothetical protein
MKIIGVTALVILYALPLLSSPATATQVEYRSIEMMGSDAQRIVRGTVSHVESHWNESRTRILTETTLEISEDYKGAGPSTVRLLQFGGMIDDLRMTVAGALDWTVGEEVVLFLEESLPGRHRVSGFSQGKFAVDRNALTGEVTVRQAGLGEAELSGATVAELQSRIPLGELLDRALPSRDGEE